MLFQAVDCYKFILRIFISRITHRVALFSAHHGLRFLHGVLDSPRNKPHDGNYCSPRIITSGFSAARKSNTARICDLPRICRCTFVAVAAVRERCAPFETLHFSGKTMRCQTRPPAVAIAITCSAQVAVLGGADVA
jgi:hypothetical protein